MNCKMLLISCLTLWTATMSVRADEGDAPPILREVKLRQKERIGSQVPLEDVFRNEQGEPVTLGECMAGKTTILMLGYYRCPQLCNQVLNHLATALTNVRKETPWTMGEQFEVVTVSFDDREKPELASAKKKSYVENYGPGLPGMEKGWHFLTGNQQSIIRLANAVGFQFRYDPKNDLFAHPSCVMILTPDGKVSRYFLALGEKTFARDLRLGLEEASEHKIGTPVTDRIVLSCFRYDPETGKYTMMALNLVRAGGVVTLILLAGFLLFVWRHDWRKYKPVEDHPFCNVTGIQKSL